MAAYFITFSCYGWHLPGQEGTIDRENNRYRARLRTARRALERAALETMRQTRVSLSPLQREQVSRAIQEVCAHKHWHFYALHVRTNHVHIVVGSDSEPELVMTTFKRYASRALSLAQTPWARHGSTRHLWTRDDIDRAVKYVLDKQGERMAWAESAR